MLNMWRDSSAGGPSATAWGNPSRPSQQTSVVGQPSQGGGSSTNGGSMQNQSSLLQVAVPPSLQSVGAGAHINLGQQAANNSQQNHQNQTSTNGNSRNSLGSNQSQHASSRSSEMSLMLAENLAESVLNNQTNGGSQMNSSTKQISMNVGPNSGSGLEKSMQRLTMVFLSFLICYFIFVDYWE